MKAIFLPVLLCGAALLTGCETVAVVDHSPYYRPGVVYYDSGRPYYYTSGVRYWGYPHGYSGYRNYGYSGYHNSYTHVDVDRDVTRNYYVDRRTVYRNGTATRHPHASTTTHVKTHPQQVVVTKKKKVHDHDDRN
jgi:hypothetical protein